MQHWRETLPPGTMLEVNYEDLVGDLEGQSRRLIVHCGLEWSSACMSFHTTDRVVTTASAAQVHQPIYRSSVGRWRAYGEALRPCRCPGMTTVACPIARLRNTSD